MLLLMAFAVLVGVTQLAVVGSLARSVRWATLIRTVIVGFFVCAVLAGALEWAWTRTFAALAMIPVFQVQDFAASTVDPVIEEVVKVLPLVLVALLRPTLHRRLGYIDHLLLGAALGSGFELFESALRYAHVGSITATTSTGFIVSASLGGTVEVPFLGHALTTWLPSPTGFSELFATASGDSVQHLVWTALAAAGICWFTRRHGPLRLVGVVPLAIVCLDHANYNARASLSIDHSLPSDLMAWVGGLLPEVLVVALIGATVADRLTLFRGARSSTELLLPGERPDGLDPRPLGRVGAAAVPWSTWVAWRFALARRGALVEAATGRVSAPYRDEVREIARRLARPIAGDAWRAGARRLRAALDLRPLRSWRTVVWAVTLIPAVVYLVIGGFPATSPLQTVAASVPGLVVLGAATLAGMALVASQLPRMWVAARRLGPESTADEGIAGWSRAIGALGAVGASVVMLTLVAIRRDPDARVVGTFHALDALSTALLVAAIALALIGFIFFPPALLLVATAEGAVVISGITISAELAAALAGSAVLGTAGVMLNEATGESGSGEDPPRFTDNQHASRTYGSSVSDIRGQAQRWASRMERKGWKVKVPQVRHDHYPGYDDVTVLARKGSQWLIRHFLFRHP